MEITFSENDTRAYFQKVIGKIYKILPICEEHLDTKQDYINSLVRELYGSLNSVQNEASRVAVITVINTLVYLSTADYTPKDFKAEVFKCIRIISRIGGDLCGL